MKNRILRWGLIGTARINQAVIPPLKASKRSKLTAVASRRTEQAEAYATQWKIPQAYGSYQALLADPDIDVVYNSLPNSMHAEWTVRAAKAGKHVLCEKPLALSLEEVEAIEGASRQAGVTVSEAFMYRHHPQTVKVKELLDAGAVGKLLVIKGAFSFNLNRPADVRWDAELGGGSIWDVGCYPISYARYVVGSEPLRVFGCQVTASSGVDEVFTGQLQFPEGVAAQFYSSFRIPLRTYMEFIGSEGALLVQSPFKPDKREQILVTRTGDVQKIVVKGPEVYSGEIEDMEAAILEGKTPNITLEDSRGNTAAILALLQSAAEGCSVQL